MIVDPDFFDHWRTRMVVDALQDEMAPVYIMRLWAHCQTRKSDRHTMPPAGLKAQCRSPHDAAKFEQALSEAGFVERVGQEICVTGWAEQNASLIAAWENGGKGGRPKKPTQNQEETHGKPSGNPAATHGEPSANPGETDKSREDKNTSSLRSDVSSKPRAAKKCPDSFVVSDDLKAWAVIHCGNIDIQAETAAFRDHTFKNAITDWDGAWRNWMRNCLKYAQPQKGAPPKETPYAAHMRQRVEQAAGSLAHIVAAKPPTKQLEPWELAAHEQRIAGQRTIASGLDGPDLLETLPEVRS